MKYLFFSVLVLLVTFLPLFAGTQGENTLSLSEALKKADEQNFDIRLSDTEVEISTADLNKTYSLFLPHITLSETFVTTNDPLNVFGLKLKQEIVSANDFNPVLLNDPKTVRNFTSKIDVQQPLINLDGLFGRAAASASLKATKEKRKRTIEYIHFEVKKAYYQLVLAQASLKVIDQSQKAVRAYRDQAKNYFDQGLIHRSDLLMAEVQLLDIESKKVDAENQLKDASDRLLFLVGIHEPFEIIPSDTLGFSERTFKGENASEVIEKRSDVNAMRYGIAAMQKIHSMNLLQLAPTINAFGSYEMNENKLFGTKGKNWMAGIMLKWELFKGWDHIGAIQKSSAQLRNAQLNYDKTLRLNTTEMVSVTRSLTGTRKKTELTQETVRQAGESLRIISDRYDKGLEKTADLLMAEATYSNARINYLQALFQYNVNLFTIEFLFENK